jgi:hypothetical protein
VSDTDVLDHEKKVRAAIDDFVRDPRHLRFVEDNEENWTSINEFIASHNLDATDPNHLHFAYTVLVREGSLELLPLGHYAEPLPTPVPSPEPVVVPVRTRTFAMRNGKAINIDGGARKL